MDNEQNKHPHAEAIKAWADGAKIQIYNKGLGKWFDCNDNQPEWKKEFQYRIKPEETEQWKPHYGERYFFVDADGLPAETYWVKDDLDFRRLKAANVFRSRKESQASSKRVIAAFRGEESEEMKKLREENEELKLRCENLHKAKEGAIKQAQECSSLSVPLSGGESALIKALRTYTIERSYCTHEGRILGVNYDDEDVVSLSIGIKLKSPHSTPVDIAASIDRIKAEQQAAADEYHSLAS